MERDRATLLARLRGWSRDPREVRQARIMSALPAGGTACRVAGAVGVDENRAALMRSRIVEPSWCRIMSTRFAPIAACGCLIAVAPIAARAQGVGDADSPGSLLYRLATMDAARIEHFASSWADYQVTFKVRAASGIADGATVVHLSLRCPHPPMPGGYDVRLLAKSGRLELILSAGPFIPDRIRALPIPADRAEHTVQIRAIGNRLEAQVDGDRADRVDAVDPYRRFLAGGFAIETSSPGTVVSGLSVEAIGQTLGTDEVLGRSSSISYYPSLNRVAVRLDAAQCSDQPWASQVTKIAVFVHRLGEAKAISRAVFPAGSAGYVAVPRLPNGRYSVDLTFLPLAAHAAHTFDVEHFAWEGNRLGITDRVYPPFTPLEVHGSDVDVVGRTYRMNAFGLFDQVRSLRHDLLAGPMSISVVANGRPVLWRRKRFSVKSLSPVAARCEAESDSDSIRVRTRSTVEVDGCTKVEMDLLPGPASGKIQSACLEIPLKDAEVPLFFPQLEYCRSNYAGPTPRGGKIVWEPRHTEWMQYPAKTWHAEPGPEDGTIWTPEDCYGRKFAYVVWLGGPVRGLAWFADNDRGYVLDPNRPCQEVCRSGGRVVLRIRFVNRETLIQRPIHIVFGLQASPTKPMAHGWRRNPAIPIHGGPDFGWGTFQCSDKYPVDRDFSIVDKVMEARRTGVIDRAFFESKDRSRSHQGVLVHAQMPWLQCVLGAAGIALIYDDPTWIPKQAGMFPKEVQVRCARGPIAVYFEEHFMDTDTPEWRVYQDEWGTSEFTSRRWGTMDEVMAPVPGLDSRRNTNAEIAPHRSYADFALWYANEWMKRGVSLYLDNSFLRLCRNPNTSAAYAGPDGETVPAVSVWDQRDYYKRLWNLAQEWNAKGPPYPITLSYHTTNTLSLPLHTWADKVSDLEWVSDMPADPAFILTETAGRQVGAQPDLIVGLARFAGSDSYKSAGIGDDAIRRMEWGMRTVFDIARWSYPFQSVVSDEPARSLEKALWDFGYGLPDCAVHHDWDDDPVLRVERDVHWLALARAKERRLVIVLQSFSPNPLSTHIRVLGGLGFTPSGTWRDAMTGERLPVDAQGCRVALPGAFGTRILICATSPGRRTHQSGSPRSGALTTKP